VITREILQAQRDLYLQGREKAIAQVNAFNGGIECIDNLLRILDSLENAEQMNKETKQNE